MGLGAAVHNPFGVSVVPCLGTVLRRNPRTTPRHTSEWHKGHAAEEDHGGPTMSSSIIRYPTCVPKGELCMANRARIYAKLPKLTLICFTLICVQRAHIPVK